MEAKTNSLFSPTIVYIVPESCYFRGRWFDRFIIGGNDEDQHGETWGTKESICTEARYRLFSIVQSVVDNAILWNKEKKSTFLPTSDDELCSDELVIYSLWGSHIDFVKWPIKVSPLSIRH